MSLTYYL